ncbi:MAG: pyridoxal phosphate-dependent aminotransferase, partial [Candidatus Bathyarchaeia archaeon]
VADKIDDEPPLGHMSSMGLQELRGALAERLTLEFGVDVKPENILITSSSRHAVFSAILSKVSIGDRVVIPEPTRPVYASCVELAGGRTDIVHTTLEDGWQVDIGAVDDALAAGARLIILNSPSNPTGRIINGSELDELSKMAERRSAYILSDEAYRGYSFKPYKSILQAACCNFIHVGILSDWLGVAGWRIGYVISDLQTVSRMRKILQLSVTCAPSFIYQAALKALKNDYRNTANIFRKMLEDRMNAACSELDRLPVEYYRPEGAMFIFPKFDLEGFDSRAFAKSLLREAKVAVTPGEAFGRYPEYLRLSVATSKLKIREAMRRINSYLGRMSR